MPHCHEEDKEAEWASKLFLLFSKLLLKVYKYHLLTGVVEMVSQSIKVPE